MNKRIATFALSLVAFGALTTALALPETAHAQAADKQAEKFRLSEEMKRLAQRNAWEGVEAKYEALLALGVDLDFDTHMTGAQSARYLGKTQQVYERLERAKSIDATEEVIQEMKAIDEGYGRVDIQGSERWEVTLTRPSMPFAPDERKSVEYAISVCLGKGSFKGMLPVGDYVIGAEGAKETLPFTVSQGAQYQTLLVTKQMVGAGGAEGLIVYHGPTAVAGYSFLSTPTPNHLVERPDGKCPWNPAECDAAEPLGYSGSGFGIDAGYQLGFTRGVGAGLTFGYRYAFTGQHQLHALTGWFHGVFTPANARIAVGPIYGRLHGKGTGVYEQFDIGQDPNADPTDSMGYTGYSWAGGLKLSAGYGVLDLEPLQGVVELEGFWQTDLDRTFAGFGLRVGISPRVPRFEDR